MKVLNGAIPPETVRAERLKAVVLDWAGTTVDFGSVAPARTLQQLFSVRGVDLTDAEVRRDMGLPKREHIRAIFSMPQVQDAWEKTHGTAPTGRETDALFAEFVPLQLSCLREYSGVIEGAPEAVKEFRKRGLKVGSTTGYTRAMVDRLLRSSEQEGYIPDCSVTPEEVGAGRPYPFMIFECAVRLQVYPMAAIAKVGDTPADIREGLNAGAWSIGVAGTGNGVGMTQAEFAGLSEAERAARLAHARAELEEAGAHFVVESVACLGPVLDAIDRYLAKS